MARSSDPPRDMRRNKGARRKPAPQVEAPNQNGHPTDAVSCVLHIDDDPNDTELLLAATVEAEVPFRVHHVTDATEAVGLLSGAGKYADRVRYPLPDLILLDLKMPRSTGIDLLTLIQTLPELKGIPVIILSGSILDEDMRQAYASGATAYLVKPLGFSALVELVKSLNLGWCVPSQNIPARINRQFRTP